MFQTGILLCLVVQMENYIKLNKENIICSKYTNVIKVQKHKFAYIKFLTKNCNIPVVSGKLYHRKVYNECMRTTCNVLGDKYHFVI